ncbi:5-hydroxytryptamine receptor 4-like [Saccoglossus kowalevskii]|uniref:Beta-2 adrenergic receptor-like n=1 Tax=Saccoglossus kowalevskii TaxID=10224 RepID=A0ABM0M3B9_SACKO|nr:PREDICTED: beta-2 adrenergic receptor-like [Saccoglossus kowalevskii]
MTNLSAPWMDDGGFANNTEDQTVKLPSSVSALERYIEAILLSIGSAMGISGNLLVIVAVRLSRKLQTKAKILIAHLAITDFIISGFVIPFTLRAVVRDYWPFSSVLCTIISSTTHSLLMATAFFLSAIALNRYFVITKPIAFYRKMYGGRKLYIWSITIWIGSFSFPAFLTIIGIGQRGYNIDLNMCDMDYSFQTTPTYVKIMSMVCFPGPIIIMIICYIGIFRHVRLNSKKVRPTVSTVHVQQLQHMDSEPTGITPPPTPPRKKTKPIPSKEIKMAKISVLLVILFCLSYGPLVLVNLLDPTRTISPLPIRRICKILPLLNSDVNPLIYVWNDGEFRHVFYCIVTFRFRKIPERVFWTM